MQTFFMFGKYSLDAFKEISSERTDKAVDIIEKSNGKVISMYVLLGEYDLVLITEFPDLYKAMKASISLTRLSGISFITQPAVTVGEFDRIIQ